MHRHDEKPTIRSPPHEEDIPLQPPMTNIEETKTDVAPHFVTIPDTSAMDRTEGDGGNTENSQRFTDLLLGENKQLREAAKKARSERNNLA